ncbi:MAG TPA: hypothetical protein VEY51_02175, partial [Chondromyces sp.]|nr:hypothetical protein [Chondromyces sp.]
DRGFALYKGKTGIGYLETKEHIAEWLTVTEEILQEREAQFLQMIGEKSPVLEGFEPIVLMIDGLARFQQTIDSTLQERIASFMKKYSHLGFRLIVSGNATEFSKGFDSLTNEIKQIRQALILMKKLEQNLFPLPFSRKEGEIQPGFGYFVLNGQEHKIQIPQC